jgi:quercetin dioxygenase-like cupin family protein
MAMEFISGNVFIRKMSRKAGEVVAGHKHNFDHTTIFFSGSWRVRATLPDGRTIEQDFVAPSHALIRKDVEHEIACTADGEFWCVYSHRTPQGEVTQLATGWAPAYMAAE